ncbi:MAG: hypothetical protein IKN05_09185, partial [Clostridia bacterium]|nr:hypothetical protein [Clostridia bacterium]
KQNGSVFLGWYYDEELTLLAGPDDKVDRNMTLYPRFGLREGMDDEFSYNFVAEKDVSPDYEVRVQAHNLTLEAAAELLAVWDATRVEQMEFTLERVEEPEQPFDLANLGLAEEQLNAVEALIEAKQKDDQLSLSDALREQGIEEAAREKILAEYAPKELEAEQSAWMDDEALALMERAGIDGDISGVPDFNKLYGLEEDDSPERYWREDLGMEPEDVLALQEISARIKEEAWANTATYIVRPAAGAWTDGHTHQVEILDTASLRFIYNDEETDEAVVWYNFSIPKQEFNNMRLNDGIVFIPASDVEGVGELNGLYNLVADDEGQSVESNEGKGVLTCATELRPGATVAIYDGTLNADNTVDGEVGYFRILGSLGDDKYAYEGADFMDVVFTPDVFPVKDDGTFDDGRVTLSAEDLAFEGPLCRQLKLDAATTVDIGDYVYFYSGTPGSVAELDEKGIGRITAVRAEGDGLAVEYERATLDELQATGDAYIRMDRIEIPMTDAQLAGIGQTMCKQIEESRFADATGEYITRLICEGDEVLPDDPEMADALKNMTLQTDTGEEITIGELRQLAGGPSRVTVSKPTVSFNITQNLDHFDGQGLRLVVSAGFTISIALNGDNKIEIELVAGIEQEIVLGLDVDVDVEWDVIIPSEVTIDAGVRAGTFTGFGAQATVLTKSENANEDAEWNSLIETTGVGLNNKQTYQLLDMATSLEKLSKNLDKVQKGGTVSKSKGEAAKTESGETDVPTYSG